MSESLAIKYVANSVPRGMLSTVYAAIYDHAVSCAALGCAVARDLRDVAALASQGILSPLSQSAPRKPVESNVTSVTSDTSSGRISAVNMEMSSGPGTVTSARSRAGTPDSRDLRDTSRSARAGTQKNYYVYVV